MPTQEPSETTQPVAPQPSREDAIGTAKWLRLLIVLTTLLSLIGLCAIVIRLGMAIHHTILLFSLGALLAYALDPLVEKLRHLKIGKKGKSISRSLSTFVVMGGLLLLVIGGIAWLGGMAAHQIKVFQRDAPRYRERALLMADDFDAQVLRSRGIDFSLRQNIENPPPEFNRYAQAAGRDAVPILAHTATALAESIVVLLITLYLLIFSEEMKDKANGQLPPQLQRYALAWERDVNRILGGFVRGQMIIACAMGAAAAVGLLAIGIHLWLLIGLFVVVAALIPVFGPYIGAVPAIIAALVTRTHMTPIAGAIAVAILFVVLNEAGSKILYPKLVGEALNLHEVAVLFVIFAGLEIDGVVGVLFAAPVAALCIVSIVHLFRLWQETDDEPLSDLVERKSPPKSGFRLFKSKLTEPT